VTYEEALQIAMEELDEKIEYLSDTFDGHSARIESYIYDLSMARKALMQSSGEKRKWVGLTQEELQDLCVKSYHTDNAGETHFDRGYFANAIEAKLKELNT
jgi:hypothetical protein